MMQRESLQLFIAKKKKKRDLSRFSSLNFRMFVKSAPNFFVSETWISVRENLYLNGITSGVGLVCFCTN